MSLTSHPQNPAQTDELYDLVRLTLRLSRQFKQTLDEPFEQSLGLNTKELLVLAAIMDGAQTPSRIAQKQHLPAPTVTRIVSKLVAAGLVERVTQPTDLRCFDLRLTPAGQAVRARVRGTGQDVVQAHFGQVPPATVQAALKALRNLQDALSSNAPEVQA